VWPLFHDLQSLCNFEPAYWRAYCDVNRRFAEVVAGNTEPGDFIWVHDYHLMNLAGELRRAGVRSRVGFFLHIPFPSPDLFLKLPWRREVLQSLLEYDLIGFQTQRDRRNFVQCVRALVKDADIEGRGQVLLVSALGRVVRVGSFPISIDYNTFMRRAVASDVAERARELHRLLPNRKLILGVDRLDYTKGIPLRLKAFQSLLSRFPELRERVSYIQVVVPSREDIPRYQELKTEIEQLVSKINGSFVHPGGWVPVWYVYRSLSRLDLLAYYRAADIALVTPLRDGMNLVAKEYCAQHRGGLRVDTLGVRGRGGAARPERAARKPLRYRGGRGRHTSGLPYGEERAPGAHAADAARDPRVRRVLVGGLLPAGRHHQGPRGVSAATELRRRRTRGLFTLVLRK
jgi:trehalose 6-phosphate synthase